MALQGAVLVGEECAQHSEVLDLSYPIAHGLVASWEDMLHVWDHAFEAVLKLDGAARARSRILLTEPPLNPLANRRRLIDTMLGRYGFAGVQVQVQAVLTLYAQGAAPPPSCAHMHRPACNYITMQSCPFKRQN
jgi:actin-related protein 2